MNALYRAFQKLIKEELRKEMPERWRPAFHVAPPVGWLNDPNGLCQKDGIYHAFFQMAPFEPQGGLKFWGHSVSPKWGQACNSTVYRTLSHSVKHFFLFPANFFEKRL